MQEDLHSFLLSEACVSWGKKAALSPVITAKQGMGETGLQDLYEDVCPSHRNSHDLLTVSFRTPPLLGKEDVEWK